MQAFRGQIYVIFQNFPSIYFFGIPASEQSFIMIWPHEWGETPKRVQPFRLLPKIVDKMAGMLFQIASW